MISKEQGYSSGTNANQCRNRSSGKFDPTFGKMATPHDNGHCADTAFLVFSQDFNSAAHIIKNQLYKIHKAINIWSKNWLSERSQNIIIGEYKCNHKWQIHVQKKYLYRGPANLHLIHGI